MIFAQTQRDVPTERGTAIVVAGRPRVRFGGPKQLVQAWAYAGAWSVSSSRAMTEIERIVVVTNGVARGDARGRQCVSARAGRSRRGRPDSQESVRAGLAAAGPCDAVLVHDGARRSFAPTTSRGDGAPCASGRGAISRQPAVEPSRSWIPRRNVVRETPDRANMCDGADAADWRC